MARRLTYFATVWPEASSSAAGVRSLGMLDALRQSGWDITVSSACAPNAFMKQLQVATGITAVHTPLNDSAAARALLSGEAGGGAAPGPPDVVLFDRFIEEEKFGHFVAEAAPHAATVLDTQDLHAVRRARQAHVEAGGWDVCLDAALAALPGVGDSTLARELAAMARCDTTLVCSDWEKHFLRDVCGLPAHKVALASFYYPPLPEDGGVAASEAAWEARRGFAFLGNFRHAPNADAVEWLMRLWPHIRRRVPGGELHLYGAYPGARQRQLHAPARGIFMHGHVPDIAEPLARHRVMLAPLRFGAGVKGKVLDAWAAGMPVVTTPIGAEGILPLDQVLCPPTAAAATAAATAEAPPGYTAAGPADAASAVRGEALPAAGRGMASDDEYAALAAVPVWGARLRLASAAAWREGGRLPRGLGGALADALSGQRPLLAGGEEAGDATPRPPRADLSPPQAAMLCGDEGAVVSAAAALHEDAGAWGAAVAAGQGLLLDRFSAATNGPAFASVIAGVAASLPARRAADLPRAVLQHGSTAYTKYFSRYLETKAALAAAKSCEPR